ncbi:hypothetical protein FACS1894178_3110 [Bacteroidia bacterium]|nr:hypothetical protein FACS1894178_3110 [Bacteroidia bacterium]
MIYLEPDSDSISSYSSTLNEIEEQYFNSISDKISDFDSLRAQTRRILWGGETEIDAGNVKTLAIQSRNAYPFPDKYDRHFIGTYNLNLYDTVKKELTNKEVKAVQTLETTIATQKASIATYQRNLSSAVGKLTKKAKTGMKANAVAKILQKLDKGYGKQISTARVKIEEAQDDIYAISVGKKRSTIFTAMRDQKKDIEIVRPQVEEKLKNERVAHQLVQQWFSSTDGKLFDMSTIQERGLYDASQIDIDKAKGNVRGNAALADAGEELIANTFVTVTDLNFFSNRPIAEQLRAAADVLDEVAKSSSNSGGLIGGLFALGSMAASAPLRIAASAIEDGFTVFSKTFLYKLKWDEETAAEFYSIWGDEDAFKKMNFELEYVGVQYEKSKVNAGVFNKKENRQMETVVKKLVNRNLDENFANLQKNYDVFKVKFPILSDQPLSAQIGMKEGLKGGERFEILEQVYNPETGLSKWQRVGTTTASRKAIWDNRFAADEEDEEKKVSTDKSGEIITATQFTASPKAQVGMLLRQIK